MKFAPFLLLLLFTSCATTYQPNSFSGGFSETKYSSDVIKISFNGNGYTSSSIVADYCFLRAADYTYQNGFKYFYILDNNNDTSSSLAQVSPGQVQYNAYTNSATYSAPTYMTINKSSSSLLIRISNENRSGAVDALDVRTNLSKSLGVNIDGVERAISSEKIDEKRYQNFPEDR